MVSCHRATAKRNNVPASGKEVMSRSDRQPEELMNTTKTDSATASKGNPRFKEIKGSQPDKSKIKTTKKTRVVRPSGSGLPRGTGKPKGSRNPETEHQSI